MIVGTVQWPSGQLAGAIRWIYITHGLDQEREPLSRYDLTLLEKDIETPIECASEVWNVFRAFRGRTGALDETEIVVMRWSIGVATGNGRHVWYDCYISPIRKLLLWYDSY